MEETTQPTNITNTATTTEVSKIKLEILCLKDQKTETLWLGPNNFNILMFLLAFKNEKREDLDSYVITCSGALDANGRAQPMKVDALIADYSAKTLAFDSIQAVIADMLRFLVSSSTLMSANINFTFMDLEKGPAAVSLTTQNSYVDNTDLVEGCMDMTFQAAGQALQKYVDSKKSKKGNIIMPDQKIVVPGQKTPKGGLIIPG